jgi:hypothetical protein
VARYLAFRVTAFVALTTLSTAVLAIPHLVSP